MFRRKEESLFDNDIDVIQESEESATVVSSASQHAPSAPSSSYNPSMPRPPVSAPSAGSFRPSTPASSVGDLTRSRLPEVSSKPAGSSAPAASSPAPAVSTAPSSSVAEKNSKGGARRVLTVGNDILLKGEIATCDRLVIEGKVEATLNDVHTVEISESGSFKGSANIEDAEIRGLFDGDLVVRNRLVIYASGKVRGKITYGEIEIERGGEMTGEIKINNTASASAYGSAPARSRQPKDDKVAA